MRLSFAALAAFLALGLAQPAAADPKAVLDNLSKRAPTLLDLSLARLEAYLQADANANGYWAFARAEDEKIKIMAWSPAHPGTEEACKTLLDRVRSIGGVDPVTGWPLDPASLYASYFNYTSFTAFDVDPSYDETVDSMIEINAVIGISGDGESVSCRGALLSNEAVFSRE